MQKKQQQQKTRAVRFSGMTTTKQQEQQEPTKPPAGSKSTRRCNKQSFISGCSPGFQCIQEKCVYTGGSLKPPSTARKLNAFLNVLSQLTEAQRKKIKASVSNNQSLALQLINGQLTAQEYLNAIREKEKRIQQQRRKYIQQHPQQDQYY